MLRQVRIQYEGAVYHVMFRGDRREGIFADDGDREMFSRSQTLAAGEESRALLLLPPYSSSLAPFSRLRPRSLPWMKASMSPSIIASILLVSTPVRRSMTFW